MAEETVRARGRGVLAAGVPKMRRLKRAIARMKEKLRPTSRQKKEMLGGLMGEYVGLRHDLGGA